MTLLVENYREHFTVKHNNSINIEIIEIYIEIIDNKIIDNKSNSTHLVLVGSVRS